mmetsp:Transcript_23728/g.47166  ORF Transcript_23728/g.47166 Transcript_23728/m.47166 type:complete len:144 (-) Transcript_23728:117-548(-)
MTAYLLPITRTEAAISMQSSWRASTQNRNFTQKIRTRRENTDHILPSSVSIFPLNHSDHILSAPFLNVSSAELPTHEIRNLPSLPVCVPADKIFPRTVLLATFKQNSVKAEIYNELDDTASFTATSLIVANLGNNKIYSDTIL